MRNSSLGVQLGKRIRQLRRLRNVTQAQLAEACDLSNNFVALLERGRSSPSLATIHRLAKELQVPVADLFEFEADSTRLEGRETIVRNIGRVKNGRDLRILGEIVRSFISTK